MRNTYSKQSGFAFVELLLIVAVLGIIAFVAWRVIDANGTVSTTQVPQSTVITDKDVPPVTSASDLDKLESQMNETALDDESTLTQLDTQTTF